MLDRDTIEDFLDQEMDYMGLEIPQDIPKAALIDAFWGYIENDYYEWLSENFRVFFNDGEPDWDWIRDQVSDYEE